MPWVDIRSHPEQYFDVDRMWLEDVQVEDPSHLRRRSLLSLLRQYRARDDRFLRFTGVQRDGELVHTGLYPAHTDDTPSEDDQVAPATLPPKSNRPHQSKISVRGRRAKGKGKARQLPSSEPDAVSTDDDEGSVTEVLGGHVQNAADLVKRSSIRTHPRPRIVTRQPATQLVVVPHGEGLLTLSDYAEQPPDEFRERPDQHISYVKALAPGDVRLHAAADRTFGFRSSPLEQIQYVPLRMMPWATWYYPSVTLPSPRIFDYALLWPWISQREYITGDLFYNKAGQLEQLTFGFAMLLQELHSTTFDRLSPSDEVIERESILTGEMTINSAVDIIHSALDFILMVLPPPSNIPVGETPQPSQPVSEPSFYAMADTDLSVLLPELYPTHVETALPGLQSPAHITEAVDTDREPETEDAAELADLEEGSTEESGTSDALLRKRKRAATGPSTA